MISPILTLGIAILATILSVTTKEEIVKVATAFIAIFAAFIALCYTPWVFKLLVIATILMLDRLSARFTDTQKD